MRLLFQALMKFLIGCLFCGLLVFVPAGTFAYPGGWLFLGLLFVPMLVFGAVLFLRAPDLPDMRITAAVCGTC